MPPHAYTVVFITHCDHEPRPNNDENHRIVCAYCDALYTTYSLHSFVPFHSVICQRTFYCNYLSGAAYKKSHIYCIIKLMF
jgi:hypothetical protein